MHHVVAALGLSAAALYHLPAAAQMSAANLSSFYLGGSVGQSTVDDCNLPGCDDKDTAWRVLGGYQINRNFAVELGYHDLGKLSFSGSAIEAKTWELVGIASWPITNVVSVYGKLGAHHGEAKRTGLLGGKETNTEVTYGVGAQYDLQRNLGIRAEWQRYPKVGGVDLGGERDVDVFGVGVVWRFQ